MGGRMGRKKSMAKGQDRQVPAIHSLNTFINEKLATLLASYVWS